jgi:5-methylthioadenosine/S-adenosylhomocysteine deaminase
MTNYFSSASKEQGSVLISGAKIVLTESGVARDCSLFVMDKKICDIGDRSTLLRRNGNPDIEIDASNCLVMPGFINNHSHMAMSLLRGYAEDLPLLRWLRERVWPVEATLKPSDIYLGAALSAAECLLSGTTCITSMYFYHESGNEAQAVFDSGLRGILAHGIFDWTAEDGLKKTVDFVKSWHGRDEGRIRVAVSSHAPYSCGPDLLKKIEQLRTDLNSKFGHPYKVLSTIHVAEARNEQNEISERYKVETKKGVATYLRSLGVLTEDTIAAHCIHLTDEDFVTFKTTRASIASCPVSNLKVGMGVADLSRALREGIVVSLGTDGPASNNSLDMFETMKMASLLQKGIGGDTTLMGAYQAFKAATLGGAMSMHQEDLLGSISIGKLADIVVLDLSRDLRSTPLYDPYFYLAYAASSASVRDVLVDGRIIVRDRKILGLDLDRLRADVEARAAEIQESSV